MLHHYHKQGLRKFFTLVGHMKSNSEVGKIVTVGVEMFWMLIGFEKCPFESPSQQGISIYENKVWFLFIHRFLWELDLSIILLIQPYMKKKCARDRDLMEAITTDWCKIGPSSFQLLQIILSYLVYQWHGHWGRQDNYLRNISRQGEGGLRP